MKKHITIITPFYPITHRNDIFEDTKAIYYLVKEKPEHVDLTIVHSYVHSFRNLLKYVFGVLPLKKRYEEYLHKDYYGNDVLFFQNMLFLPKTINISEYFNSKYEKLYSDYIQKKKIEDNSIVVVHFPTYYKKFISKRHWQKKIAVIHAFDLKNIKNRKNLEYWSDYFNQFDSIAFRSYRLRQEFESLLGVIKNSFICLSGIPANYVTKSKEKIQRNCNGSFKILYVGRLDSNKNVKNSILALTSTYIKQEIVFNVIGEGSEKKNLLKVVKKYSLEENVKFLGVLQRDEVFKMMCKSDVFIMVSKKETLGLVYLEAMAAGCIVIGSKGQGIDGIIRNGENGFLVNPNNINEISSTLEYISKLSDFEKGEIIKNSQKTVENLTDSEVSKEYFKNILLPN